MDYLKTVSVAVLNSRQNMSFTVFRSGIFYEKNISFLLLIWDCKFYPGDI